MKEITVVTGPMRSGTSCVTGMLERSGFDLGRNVRILRKKTRYNPMGHFEPDLLFAINKRLLSESSNNTNDLFPLPEEQALIELAAKRERYFRLFIRKFDGELCKDPLMCLTLPLWEKYWSELRRAVFCLRHPMAVARSMEKRYRVPVEQGLELWQAYAARFFYSEKRTRVFIFDFDAFINTPVDRFGSLLNWLGRPMDKEGIQKRLDGFFNPEYVACSFGETVLQTIPIHVRDLYMEILSHVGPYISTCTNHFHCTERKLPSMPENH